jgi:uncharacterized protein YoaH (UPF0181 family)
VLTDHHNLQGFIKNKPLRGRLGCWWKTLSGYELDIVYWTGITNSAVGLSRRPNYKVAAEVEDRHKQAEKRTRGSQESAQSSARESEEGQEKVACISTAQVLRPWEQRLAVTARSRLLMVSQSSLGNACRLVATVIRQDEEEDMNLAETSWPAYGR